MSKPNRVEVQKELILNIKRRAIIGLGVSVDPAYFEQQVGQIGGIISPYTFAVFGCLTNIERWAQRTGYTGKVAYFFEAGHEKQSEANAVLTELAKKPQGQQFRYFSHTFADKSDAPPLQAADMLAWQMRKFHKDRLDGKDEPRKDFVALIRPHDRGIDYTRGSIDEFVEIIAQKDIVQDN